MGNIYHKWPLHLRIPLLMPSTLFRHLVEDVRSKTVLKCFCGQKWKFVVTCSTEPELSATATRSTIGAGLTSQTYFPRMCMRA